ncbi:putative bifunctional diguanylate cyclase/phosphodiesterase [Erythrobacter aurantius]|uniref:putative bifunctional diguanylate cyclase/phosphodiesterase n=1 Tax=Erythrobacter aurantius TaxID=2909249 RepID=UPI00207AB2F7|nr:EAL domain-containing protein [Erythrobacter aurantius]
MPLKGFLSRSGSKVAAASATSGSGKSASALSDGEKLAMLNELERSGLGWFWASDKDGKLTYLSATIADRIDIALDDLLGKPLPSVFVSADREGRSKSLSLMLNAHRAFSGFAVRAEKRPQGAVLRLAGQPIIEDGEFCGFRGTGADITEEYYREEETERLAKFDSLTGLSNRHRMKHQIESTITAFKAAKRNCAIMMLDLDKFKHVNDTLGHAAGDELLKQVAERLRRSIEVDCEIGRLGGDEFQVLIPDKDDRGELGDIAMKVITMLKQPYSLEEGRCVIGCSVGIAIAPHDGVTADEVVKSADLALYAAKNGGRGQFRFFSGELENEALFRRRLEEDLGAAVRDEQLFLKYEPIVSADTEEVRALEAHICWNHPQRGEIDEEEFASIIDGSSQVGEVGTWAIREACKDAVQWPDSIRVAVNVPVALFAADGFVEAVGEALQEADISAARLELEISEAVFFGDTSAVDRTLDQLFKLGVRLTLDEFGSGYSSLAYLRRAPFDAIKIDENLISEAEKNDTSDLGLITAIVALANALRMDTIANGIETTTIFQKLKDCGVKRMEGPIFSDPISRETVQTELVGGNWKIAPSSDRIKRSKRRTVFRKIQVIHDDHSYEVTLRNLSRTGALIQGLSEVPKGTQFVVDLGGGQLAVATVIRTNGDTQGLEFEQSLVDDGAGGLCTRNRVSPYALAAAGAPLAALAQGAYEAMPGGGLGQAGSVPQFSYAAPSKFEGV